MAKKNLDAKNKILSYLQKRADEIAINGGHPDNFLRYRELVDIIYKIESDEYLKHEEG